jgi:hypothetical protein
MANGQIEKFTPLILLLIALVAKTPFPSSIPGLLIWPFFSSTSHFTLNLDPARSSETLVTYHNIVWHHNPEDLNINVHCHENLKSRRKLLQFWIFLKKIKI